MKIYEECKKALKKILEEEKLTKQKLDNIQKTKMECIRILLDEEYARIIGDISE